MGRSIGLLFVSLAAVMPLAGCPAPRGPVVDRDVPLAPRTVEIGRDGGSLRAVAGGRGQMFAAITMLAPAPPTGALEPARARTTLEARRGDQLVWHLDTDGAATAMTAHAGVVIATVVGRGLLDAAGAPITLRGEPGTVMLAIDAALGAVRWRITIDATEWAEVTSLASADDGDVIAGGTFAGSLRIGDKVVSSAGRTDGFVARLSPNGAPRWLIRVGGSGADAVQGVAIAGARIAIAGTASVGAELLGEPLPPIVPRTPYADGFVAELDAAGTRKWSTTFGGAEDDAIAGVAIDAAGHIVVAATVRGSVQVGTIQLTARGPADGMVAWFSPTGVPGPAVLIGGPVFDGLRAIVAVGDRVVVAGFYAGQLQLGDRALAAGGGDDAFVAALDATGKIVESWPIGGPGREEVTALSAVLGGWIAGVAHTAAATIDAASVPAPHDPLAGAALVVRMIP